MPVENPILSGLISALQEQNNNTIIMIMDIKV